jgi:hypothetical protein
MGAGEEIDHHDVEKNQADAKQKAIDDWLPVTASRNAKWWYSAFHNLTAMVGAGVLSLPYAMSHMGWYEYILVLYCRVNRNIETVFFYFHLLT